MSNERGIVARLPGALREFFLLEGERASISGWCLYKAFDRGDRISIGLWVSREPLDARQAVDFVGWIEKFIAKIKLVGVRSFGIDADGFGYVALSSIDGVKITSGAKDIRELERRFLLCVHTIARFHDVGLVSGNISSESFLVARDGAVRFIAVVPSVAADGKHSSDEASECSLFRRPASRAVAVSPVDDVYALLVLGYRLCSGTFPVQQAGIVPDARLNNPASPRWIDELVTPLLHATATELPLTARAFLDQLKQLKDEQLAQQLAPVLIESERLYRSSPVEGVVQVNIGSGSAAGRARVGLEERLLGRPGRRRDMMKLLLAVLVVGGFYVVSGGSQEDKFKREVLDLLPADVVDGQDTSVDGVDHRDQLKRMFESEDPLAHDALIRELRVLSDGDERVYILEGILARSARLGLPLAAQQVREWTFNSLGSKTKQGTLDVVLRVLDPLVPANGRAEMLMGLYGEEPSLASRLALALAFDSGLPDVYRPVVARFAQESVGIREVEKSSLFAIAAAVPDLSKAFAQELQPTTVRLSDEDLLWLVPVLSARDPELLTEVSGILRERGVLTGARMLFLQEATATPKIPEVVRSALVRCAIAGPTRKEVGVFANWTAAAAGRVLLLVIATAQDATLVPIAFDFFASKPIDDTALLAIIEQIRSASEIDRGQAARVVAAIGLGEKLTDQDISTLLADLSLTGGLRAIIRTATESQADRVLVSLLQRYGASFDSGLLLDMIKRGRPLVQAGAIEVLAQSGDEITKKRAAEYVVGETDVVVRAAYEKYLRTSDASG